MKKNILKKLLSYKLTVLLLVFIGFLSLFIIFSTKIKNILEMDPFGIYNVYHTIYYYRILSFLVIPYFLIILQKSSSIFDSIKVILSYGNIKSWFKEKIITNALLSLAYVLIINTPLFVLLFINRRNPYTVSYGIFSTALIFQFIGFNIISVLYNIVEIEINFKNIGFLSIMILIILNEFKGYFFKMNPNSMINYMALNHKVVLNDYSVNFVDVLMITIYIIVFILIYNVACIRIDKKEFYWSK